MLLYQHDLSQEAFVNINQDEICLAMQMAKTNQWTHGIPVIRARVRLAVNSLLSQDKDLFQKSDEVILKTLRLPRNKGVRKILKETGTESFAFAVYTALN